MDEKEVLEKIKHIKEFEFQLEKLNDHWETLFIRDGHSLITYEVMKIKGIAVDKKEFYRNELCKLRGE